MPTRKVRTVRVRLYVGPCIVRTVALGIGLCCPQANNLIEGTEHVIWDQEVVSGIVEWGVYRILDQVAEQTGWVFLTYASTRRTCWYRVLSEREVSDETESD